MDRNIIVPDPENKYSISFNYRIGKIRIFKPVITVLGIPTHLQFLLDPDEKVLYVRGTETSGVNCLEVPSEEHRKRNCCVLYGKTFIKKLSNLVGWSLLSPHIISGKYDETHNTLIFDLSVLDHSPVE